MERKYIPKDFEISTWELLRPYFDDLLKRVIDTPKALATFISDYNELGAVVSENMAWRYIKMTCDTNNKTLRDRYNDFVQNIEPHMAPLSNDLNKKINDSPFANQIQKQGYPIYLRALRNSILLFREENIALNTQLQELEQQFGAINGEQSIDYNGEKMTLQKAAIYLKDTNRKVRETVYYKIQ